MSKDGQIFHCKGDLLRNTSKSTSACCIIPIQGGMFAWSTTFVLTIPPITPDLPPQEKAPE